MAGGFASYLAALAHVDRIAAISAAAATEYRGWRAMLAGAKGITLDHELDRALVATARAMLAGQLAVPSALGRQIAPRPLS